jgi:hypothetical protein
MIARWPRPPGECARRRVALESLARGDQTKRHRAAGVHRVDVDARQLAHPPGDSPRGAQRR